MPDWRVVGASPWDWANENDRERARAVVAEYATDAEARADHIAEAYETRRWCVLNARWLALASGLLEKAAGGGYRPTRAGMAMIETGVLVT